MEINVEYKVVQYHTSCLEIPQSLLIALDDQIKICNFSSEKELRDVLDDFISDEYEFHYDNIDGFDEITEMEYEDALDILVKKYKYLIIEEVKSFCSKCGSKLK